MTLLLYPCEIPIVASMGSDVAEHVAIEGGRLVAVNPVMAGQPAGVVACAAWLRVCAARATLVSDAVAHVLRSRLAGSPAQTLSGNNAAGFHPCDTLPEDAHA
ncbi:MAG: hypothetical protein JSS43_27995 [Proteobacteria bacterium]|nr:hypothetical protein [Pseudomonadota bacterium]